MRWEIGKEEAYDLRADPAEPVDLAGNDAVIAPLRAMLDQFKSTARPGTVPVSEGGAVHEALRAIGYTR